MRSAISIIIFMLAIQFIVAQADSGKVKVTGIYSDLAYNKESGDVLGDEALVVFSKIGYFVVFQASEGEPYAPVVVPATVDGSSITFILPSEIDARGEFQGRIVNDELVGTFKANSQTIHLKRKNSYWQ